MALTADELGPPLSDAAIVEKIVYAVMEQKLSAGAKLPEAALCDAFDCSRSQIRRILVVLADRGVVTLQADRFAARPGPPRPPPARTMARSSPSDLLVARRVSPARSIRREGARIIRQVLTADEGGVLNPGL